MRRAAACAAIGMGLLYASGAAAGQITIDGFATAQTLLVDDATPMDEDGVPAADAIGGARHATLERLGGYGTDTLTVNGGGFGLLDLSSAAADRVVATLLYDGGTDGDISFDGLGGADLTDLGTNTLIRILARSDLVAPLTITVYTDAGNASRATRSLPGLGFASFTELDIPFDGPGGFTAFLGAGANFASVGAIVVELSGAGTPSLDAQLDSIFAVPEPGSAALLAVGLVGLVVAGRRRA
jgi:hypothetical protein